MRFSGLAIALFATAVLAAGGTRAQPYQYQAPSEKLQLTAKAASTWSDGATDVVQLDGPATIELDRAVLSAQNAVVWITPVADAPANAPSCEFRSPCWGTLRFGKPPGRAAGRSCWWLPKCRGRCA